jgi:uncharacterized membrane protein YhdT
LTGQEVSVSFISEIKRRKVFRMAIAYVIVAWVIIQVVTAIEEPLQLPDWFDTAVIVLLALGFPIVIMLSWAYDVTPDGVVREGADEPAPAHLQIDFGKIALVAVLLLGAFLLGNYIKNGAPSPLPPQTTLRQFEIGVPGEFKFVANGRRPIAITPDGQIIVLHASVNGRNQLFARAMNGIDVLPVDGTEGAERSFALSPNGKFVAFAKDGLLKKVSLNGGIPSALGKTIGRVHRITCGKDGTIVYTDESYGGLMSLPAAGGDATEFSIPQDGVTHKHPSYIPGTEWLVFSVGVRRLPVSSTDRIA